MSYYISGSTDIVQTMDRSVSVDNNSLYMFSSVYSGSSFSGANIIIGNTAGVYNASGLDRILPYIKTTGTIVSYDRYGTIDYNKYINFKIYKDNDDISSVVTGGTVSYVRSSGGFTAVPGKVYSCLSDPGQYTGDITGGIVLCRTVTGSVNNPSVNNANMLILATDTTIAYSGGNLYYAELQFFDNGNLITSFSIYTPTPTYTVNFDSNGGVGTMPPQEIIVDLPTPLNANTFTRTNFAFYGWSYTESGTVAFADGETVTNLAPENESVTLYAVWGLPQMEIVIERNKSEKNKLDKDVEIITTLSGRLRNETSIIDPVITISGNLESLANANYMEIPAFKRKYFITNIRTIRTGIVEISAHVDVLSSFATEIRSNKAIVHKQENEWNLYLNDGTFKIYSDTIIETYLFPISFPGQFSYVLAVAGGGSNANE